MYWDINRTVTYNALFNFIVGNRGGGKTFGFKRFVINKFLKTGEQFYYLRRYKTELKNIKSFFADIAEFFPNHEFAVNGGVFKINDKIAGYYSPLSTAKVQKSSSFPNVTNICFDEFILDKGTYHYLSSEVQAFLDFYETIARMRNNCRVFFLANALTKYNPYFLYFNLHTPYKNTIVCKNDVLVELVQNEDFISAKKQTRFANLIRNTEYAAYAIDNKFLLDSDTFIMKKYGNCHCMFNLIFETANMGVWSNPSDGYIFVSPDIDPSCRTYACTKNDHTPNTLLLSTLKKSSPFRWFLKNFELGNVFFENQLCKKSVFQILKTISNI